MTIALPTHEVQRRMRGQPLIFLMTVVLLWTGARVAHHLTGSDGADGPTRLVATAHPAHLANLASLAVPPEFRQARFLGQPASRAKQALLAGQSTRAMRRALASYDDAAGGHRFEIALAHQMLWAESLTRARSGDGQSGPGQSPLIDAPLAFADDPPHPRLPGTATASAAPVASATSAQPGPPALSGATGKSRWSIYGWSLVRQASARRTLAPAAQYGGSQAGVIVRLALGQARTAPVLYTRAAGALAIDDDRTLAMGISARPWADLPVDLAVERRLGLAGGQADRFAVMAVAGGGARIGHGDHPARVDAFGQMGLVGLRQRQGFFDLQLVAARQIGGQDRHAITLGAGLWAGGQQDIDAAGDKTWVHRVDIGPRAALALPVGDSQLVVALDWRQRIDGNAQPASGAALTVSAGF